MRASRASDLAKLQWACCDVPLMCADVAPHSSQLCSGGQRRGCALLLGMQRASFRTSKSAIVMVVLRCSQLMSTYRSSYIGNPHAC